MLSIEPIARVVVNVSRNVAVPSSFDTGLLRIRDTNFSAAKRLVPAVQETGSDVPQKKPCGH